jgi:hypothetical protein
MQKSETVKVNIPKPLFDIIKRIILHNPCLAYESANDFIIEASRRYAEKLLIITPGHAVQD